MSSKGEKSKTRKVLKIILITFLLLLLVIFFGINSYVEGIVKNKIDTQLNKNPNSLYHISYEDLDINILTGSLSIKNVLIQPSDSAKQMIKSGLLRSIVSTHVEFFKVKRLKIFDFITDKNVDISKVIVENTKTEYLVNPEVVPKASLWEKHKKKRKGASGKLFSDVLNRVNIGDFEFKNATFLLANYEHTDEYLFEIDSLTIIVKDVYMDSSTIANPIPLNFSDIDINTKFFALKSMKYYSISISGIGFNVDDTTLTLDQFRLIPKYSKEEYNQQIQYNNDWFSIETEKVVLNGLSLSEIEKSESIDLNSVVIYKPDIKIYRDKRLPDAPFKKKKLITGMVKSIPLNIDIDTLKVLDGKLVYEEILDLTDKPGKIFFDPLFLTAYNVTNDSSFIAQNAHLQIDLKGRIMGKSDLKAKLDFHLDRNDEYFTAKGNLKAISGTAFNAMIESLLLVEIQSGDVHSAAFDFSANDDISNGSLDLIYENLKVNVLKHKQPDRRSTAWTWIANGFVDKNNLPDHPKYRTGIIRFERRKDKAIVNFLWNSVKTGIISTVAPIADKNRKAAKKEQREATKKEKKAQRKSKKSDSKN
jgi:hypothetical protein